MIIVVSGGAYSEYWEQWYETDGAYTHTSLGEKLREVAGEIKWDALGEPVERGLELTTLFERCGLRRIRPDLEVDAGGMSSFFFDRDHLDRLVTGLMGGADG